jgi:TonB family protein
MGGGNGVSIGTGSGGFGDSWYARAVEARISSNWIRTEGMHVEMIYSFYIAANGTIYGIKQEKSSGNQQMDLTAERAIRASNPLAPPPQEFRGRPVQFVAQFVYPPSP